MTKRKIKRSWDDRLFYILDTVLLLFMILIVILPLMHVISVSLSDPGAVSAGRVLILPVGFSLKAYKTLINTKSIITGMTNTVYYTVMGTILNIFMTIICAYPLSRKNLPGKKFLLWIFTFTMMFGGGLIPSYLNIRRLGLLNTRWAMIIPGAMSVWNMIITRTFFMNTIPDELIEAGEIDGASDLQCFIRLVMPNSVTIVAIMALFYAVGHWNQYYTAPNGDIYGFNDVGSCYHCSYPVKMWVNEVWMKNLGITPPTTPDEFYDMLVRFKNEDANGNGDPNDEVPLSNCTEATGSSSYMAGYLMNAFTYSNPRTKYLYVKDGSAAVSYNQEGWREGLRYLNKLYAEGLMDPESYIQDRTTMKARNDSGEHPIFGAVPAQHTTVITNGNLDDRWKEYIALPPLTGPDGLCITTNTSLSNYDNFRTMISGSSKNPELAFRFCDGLFSSQEIGLLHGFGEENVRWHYAKEGELGKDGQQALYSNVTEDDHIPQEGEPYYNNYCWGSLFANYATNHSKWASPNDMSIPGTASFERYLYVNTEPYEAKKADISMVMPSFFFSEEH